VNPVNGFNGKKKPNRHDYRLIVWRLISAMAFA